MKAKHDYFCRYDDFVGKLGRHIGQADKKLITKTYKCDIEEFCISGDTKKLHRVFASIRNEIFPYIIGIGCQATRGINITLNSAIDVNQKNGTGWIADNIICIIEEIFYARKNCIEKSKNMDFLEQRFVYKMYLYSCISLVELYLNILLKKSITDKDRQIPEKNN